MSVREQDEFIIRIKKALMIPAEDTFADDEIKLHIDSCSQLLITTGVPASVVASDNPLVEGIILVYVKTVFYSLLTLRDSWDINTGMFM